MSNTTYSKRFRFLVTLAIVPFVLGFVGCGDDKQPGDPGEAGVKPVTMPKTFTGEAIDKSVPPELGGIGFEEVADSLGWETNTIDPADYAKYYASPDAKKGGLFRYAPGEGDFPATFRPFGKDAQTTTIQLIETLVYQPLITLDPVKLEFLPVLATHWKLGEDGQTYFYRINPNARFSDGHPVTAEDVLASYRMWTDSTILDPFQNQQFNQFDPPQKVSTYIVSVRSKEKNWKNMLYFGNTSILPAHQIGNIGGAEFLDKYQYDMPVGSGPYIVLPDEVRKGQSVTLTRQEDWWQKDDPLMQGQYNFDKIRLVVIGDDDQRYERFRTGGLDCYLERRAQWWEEKFDFEEIQRGLIQKRKIFNDVPQGLSGFVFNMRRPPFNDPKVREAFTLLFNRQQLIDKVMNGAYIVSDSYFANSEYANPDNPEYRYNPERAQQLLQEAGYTKRNNEGVLVHEKTGKPFVIELPLVKGSEHIMTPVQQDLKQAGIKLEIRNVDWAQQIKLGQERNFDLLFVSYAGIVYPNPTGQFRSDMADVPNTQNLSGFKNPRADELINKELVTFDQQERIKILRELDGIFMAANPYALAWYAPFTRLVFWNYVKQPEFGLSKVGDYRDIFQYWWIDTEEKGKVMKAMTDKSISFEVGETDVTFWPKYNEERQGKTTGDAAAAGS